MKKDIGKALRHKLNELKDSPDDIVWNNLAVELDKIKRRRAWFKRLLLLSSFIFFSLFFWNVKDSFTNSKTIKHSKTNTSDSITLKTNKTEYENLNLRLDVTSYHKKPKNQPVKTLVKKDQGKNSTRNDSSTLKISPSKVNFSKNELLTVKETQSKDDSTKNDPSSVKISPSKVNFTKNELPTIKETQSKDDSTKNDSSTLKTSPSKVNFSKNELLTVKETQSKDNSTKNDSSSVKTSPSKVNFSKNELPIIKETQSKDDSTKNDSSSIKISPSKVNFSNNELPTIKETHTKDDSSTVKETKSKDSFTKNRSSSLKAIQPEGYSTEKKIQTNNSFRKNSIITKISIDSITRETKGKIENKLLQKQDSTKKDTLITQTNKWSITLNNGIGYFNSLTKGNSINKTLNENPVSNHFSWYYGFYINYNTSKKFTLRFGLQYLKMNSGVKNIGISGTEKQLNSFYDINGFVALNANSNMTSLFTNDDFINITHEISYLEIPMEMKYNFTNKNNNLNFIVGYSILYLQNSNIYADSSNIKKTQIGTTNNLSELNFSINLGLSKQYELHKNLFLDIELNYKQYFITYKNNGDGLSPFLIGLQTGLTYKF